MASQTWLPGRRKSRYVDRNRLLVNAFWISPIFSPSGPGDVVARRRVEPLPGLDREDLGPLALVGVEADVLLELEPRLLHEREPLALVALRVGQREEVAVDHHRPLLAEEEDVVGVGVEGVSHAAMVPRAHHATASSVKVPA